MIKKEKSRIALKEGKSRTGYSVRTPPTRPRPAPPVPIPATLKQRVKDSKVASNEALLRLLETETMKAQFLSALVELIKEEGLTFDQRDFINLVSRRVLFEDPTR